MYKQICKFIDSLAAIVKAPARLIVNELDSQEVSLEDQKLVFI